MGIPQTWRDESSSVGAQTCDTNSKEWRVLDHAAGWLSVDSSDQVTSGVLLAPNVFITLQLPNHTHPPLLTSPACRHHLSTNARVRAQREICGGQHGTRTGFPPSTSVCLCQYYSTSAPFFWRNSPQWARASSSSRLHDHTQIHTTVCKTPLDEWSARLRDLYLTTHNTHNRHIHASGGIRTCNPSKRATAGPRRRTRGHQDWNQWRVLMCINLIIMQ